MAEGLWGPFRDGCCVRWPKPCPYHEGWADAIDHIHERSRQAMAAVDEELRRAEAAGWPRAGESDDERAVDDGK